MGTLGKGLKPDGSGCREDDGRGGGLAGIDAELDEGRFEDVPLSSWRCKERSRLPFFDQSALAFSVSFAFAGMADRPHHYASNCPGAACRSGAPMAVSSINKMWMIFSFSISATWKSLVARVMIFFDFVKALKGPGWSIFFLRRNINSPHVSAARAFILKVSPLNLM